MAMSIHANPESLRKLGNNVLDNAREYDSEVNKIYATVENLRNSWQGSDNQEYVNKVNEYRELIEALGKAIGNYGQFMIDTANNIERVTDDIRAGAANI